MPELMEGDKFTISVNGLEDGEAEIKNGKLKWKMSGEDVIDPGTIETVRGRKCAVWYNYMKVGYGIDGNCCFAVVNGGVERMICETSSFCIVKALKILKKVHGDCLGGESAEGGFKPKYTPTRPLYKNATTKNYGWDKFLAYKDPVAAAQAQAAQAAAAAAAATPGAAPAAAQPLTPEEAKKAEEARQAEEALSKSLDPRVDRHMEGKWRSRIWYYQLEDMKNEVKPEKLVVLEIMDRMFTVKPEVISPASEFIESTMTSMWKPDCSGSLACLANTFIDMYKPAKEKMMDDKINK